MENSRAMYFHPLYYLANKHFHVHDVNIYYTFVFISPEVTSCSRISPIAMFITKEKIIKNTGI